MICNSNNNIRDSRFALINDEITSSHVTDGVRHSINNLSVQQYPMPNVILATAGYDHTIRFWEAPSGICYRTVQYPDSQVNCLEITPDKIYLAAAGNPHIRLFDINSNNPNPVTSYDGHSGNVTAVGFQKNGKWMFSSSEDGTIKIWDLRAPGCQRNYDCQAPVTTVALHPDQSQLISGDQSGCVRVWDLTGDTCTQKIIPDGEYAIRSVDVARDATVAVACNNAGKCFLWHPKSTSEYELVRTTQAHDEYILKCQVSPDVQYLATASSDRTVKLWNLQDMTLNRTLRGHQRWVWDCAFSADSSYLVTASSDHSARLWDLSVGEVIRHYTHHKSVICVALNDTAT